MWACDLVLENRRRARQYSSRLVDSIVDYAVHTFENEIRVLDVELPEYRNPRRGSGAKLRHVRGEREKASSFVVRARSFRVLQCNGLTNAIVSSTTSVQ